MESNLTGARISLLDMVGNDAAFCGGPLGVIVGDIFGTRSVGLDGPEFSAGGVGG